MTLWEVGAAGIGCGLGLRLVCGAMGGMGRMVFRFAMDVFR